MHESVDDGTIYKEGRQAWSKLDKGKKWGEIREESSEFRFGLELVIPVHNPAEILIGYIFFGAQERCITGFIDWCGRRTKGGEYITKAEGEMARMKEWLLTVSNDAESFNK